jgi:hypothetical protein
MRNRLIGIAALLTGAGASVSALGVGEPPLAGRKFWANLDGGAFSVGPWVTYDGKFVEPTTAPGEGDVAVFDIDSFLIPREARGLSEFQAGYGLTIDAPVSIFGMTIGDFVAIQPEPAAINIGFDGLRIGGIEGRGGSLSSPGTITSDGEVSVGGPYTAVSGRPSLFMFSTSRLFAHKGVTILPGGLVDGAGLIEGNVFNGGELGLFDGQAASLLIRGDYVQSRAGGEGQPFGGVLHAEIAGPSEDNDILVVEGHAVLGGTLLVNLLNGYSPQPNKLDARIVTATSMEGRFDLVFFSPSIEAGLRLRVEYPPVAPPPARENLSVRVVVDTLPPQPNLGDGTDGAAEVPGRPSRAVTGDFNGDGFVDVAAVVPSDAVGRASGALIIVINRGVNPDGSWRGFADPQVLTVGFNPADLAAADVDQDGDTDIAVITKGTPPIVNAGGEPPALRVLLNDGTGVFEVFPTAYDVGQDPRGIAFGDFIHDPNGLPDAVVTSLNGSNEGQVVILTNDGVTNRAANWSGFGNVQNAPAGSPDPGPVAPGGLDNPKDIDDIAIGAGSGGGSAAINVLFNTNLLNARGSVFGSPVIVPVGSEPRNLTIADIDRDGDADIVTSNQGDGTVSIVLNRPGPVRGGPPQFVAQALPIGDQPGPVAAFDFDADTDVDIAAVFRAVDKAAVSQFIRVLRNDSAIDPPPGGGENPLIFSQGPVIDFSANPFYVLPGDVDNDGDIDVIAFTDPEGSPTRQATAFVNALCPTDLDGSGKTDTVDLCKFLHLFGQTVERGGRGDLVRDGVVDTRDLVRFLSRFGQVCR